MNFACEETGRPCAIGKPRRVAIGLGLDRYFTGVPCKRGHVAWRLTSGPCLDCCRPAALDKTYDVAIEIRKEAKALGLKRYSPGYSCVRGHASDRWVSTGDCIACHNERYRDRYWKGRERPISRMAVCPSCDVEFVIDDRQSVYCSRKCSKRENRRRAKQRNRILLKAAKQILQQGELPT